MKSYKTKSKTNKKDYSKKQESLAKQAKASPRKMMAMSGIKKKKA